MPQTTHFKKTIIPYPDGYETVSTSDTPAQVKFILLLKLIDVPAIKC